MSAIDRYICARTEHVKSNKFYKCHRSVREGKIISMQTIFNCSLNCFFCRGSINNIKELSKTPNTTQDAFEFFTSRIVDHGIKVIELTPSIGEPFLDREIGDKLEYLEANDNIEHYMLTSNLTHLSESNFELIRNCKKLVMSVSIYGHDAISYKSNTGKDLFDRFMTNFKTLIDVIEGNQDCLFEIMMRSGCSFDDYPRGELRASLLKLAAYDNVIIDDDDIKNTNRAGNLEEGAVPEVDTSSRKGVCPYGIGTGGGILPNGDVTFCSFNDINRVGVMGNLHDSSIEEIYSSKGWQAILDEHKNNTYTGICKKCTEVW